MKSQALPWYIKTLIWPVLAVLWQAGLGAQETPLWNGTLERDEPTRFYLSPGLVLAPLQIIPSGYLPAEDRDLSHSTRFGTLEVELEVGFISSFLQMGAGLSIGPFPILPTGEQLEILSLPSSGSSTALPTYLTTFSPVTLNMLLAFTLPGGYALGDMDIRHRAGLQASMSFGRIGDGYDIDLSKSFEDPPLVVLLRPFYQIELPLDHVGLYLRPGLQIPLMDPYMYRTTGTFAQNPATVSAGTPTQTYQVYQVLQGLGPFLGFGVILPFNGSLLEYPTFVDPREVDMFGRPR